MAPNTTNRYKRYTLDIVARIAQSNHPAVGRYVQWRANEGLKWKSVYPYANSLGRLDP